MEYFKYDLSLPCSGLKVMTKSKTNFCLRPFVNPILSKQKKSELYDKILAQLRLFSSSYDNFLLKTFCGSRPRLYYGQVLAEGSSFFAVRESFQFR